MKPVVVGLDTASDRWHAVERFDSGKTIRADQCKIRDRNPDVRRTTLHRFARVYFRELEQSGSPVHVFCEEPLALKNGKTTRLLGLSCGAIWAAHLEFDITWWWADVAAWKKEVVGKGSAKKPEVETWSLVHGGQIEWDEDHHDANAIAAYGETVLQRVADG